MHFIQKNTSYKEFEHKTKNNYLIFDIFNAISIIIFNTSSLRKYSLSL